jgi:hypothetical protein
MFVVHEKTMQFPFIKSSPFLYGSGFIIYIYNAFIVQKCKKHIFFE